MGTFHWTCLGSNSVENLGGKIEDFKLTSLLGAQLHFQKLLNEELNGHFAVNKPKKRWDNTMCFFSNPWQVKNFFLVSLTVLKIEISQKMLKKLQFQDLFAGKRIVELGYCRKQELSFSD